MKKNYAFLIYFLLFTTAAFAQAKPKVVPKQPPSALKKILTGINLPYNMVNDSLAVIPYEGENIKSFDVMVQKISDLYIVHANLTEIFPGKIDETKYKYLLEQNDNFDVVKTGISQEDNTAYIRADIYSAGTTTATLKKVIQQLATVTNIIGGDLNK